MIRQEFTLSEFILSEVEGTEVTYETCAACGSDTILPVCLRHTYWMFPHRGLRQHKQTALCGLAEGRRDQFMSFMQNKPNLLKRQMNVSSLLTRGYENETAFVLEQNKPNQTQFEPKTNPKQTQSNPISKGAM